MAQLHDKDFKTCVSFSIVKQQQLYTIIVELEGNVVVSGFKAHIKSLLKF